MILPEPKKPAAIGLFDLGGGCGAVLEAAAAVMDAALSLAKAGIVSAGFVAGVVVLGWAALALTAARWPNMIGVADLAAEAAPAPVVVLVVADCPFPPLLAVVRE